MNGSGSKAKGREFQKEVAEMIARMFGFTIEAMSPRSVGSIVKGASYVAEDAQPDLRVRTMGLSGPDIFPLSIRAKEVFPFLVECKIRRKLPSIFEIFKSPLGRYGNEFTKWIGLLAKQLEDQRSREAPIVVFRGARMSPWCIFSVGKIDPSEFLSVRSDCVYVMGPFIGKRRFVMMPFDILLEQIRDKIVPVSLIERPLCQCGCGALVSWNGNSGHWNITLQGHSRIHPYERPICARVGCENRVSNHINRFCNNSCKQKALYSAGKHNMQRLDVRKKQSESLSQTVTQKIQDGSWHGLGYGEKGVYLSLKTGKREGYQSRLELQFFQTLDGWGEIDFWTKAHGISIPWIDNSGAKHRYIPDVIVRMKDGETFLCEVKYHCAIKDSVVQLKAEAAHIWCKEQGYVFCFATEKNGWIDTPYLSWDIEDTGDV